MHIEYFALSCCNLCDRT